MSWQELPLARVYFDSITGVPGTTWPIGTPTVPSDVIADVIAMCTDRNLKVIDVHGALTLGAAMEHYTFIGHRHEAIADTLALAGFSVDESFIIGCLVSGAQGGAGFLTLQDCILYLLTDFQGIANYCDLYGSAMSLKNGGFQDLHHCNSVHSDLTITVNAPTRASFKEMAGNCTFTGQTGGVLFIRGYKGTLIINAMTGGSCDIYANGADITINATCTGGTINIYGNARVTDNSGATVVTDLTKETQLAVIEAALGSSGLDTQIRTIQSGIKVINGAVTKYLHIDSDTNGAEILSIVIEGVINHDWTLDVYVPTADGEAATQPKSKRDTIPYLAADNEGGLLSPFGIPFDCYLDFTNNGANDQIDQVTITYRSRAALTLTWEA